MTPGNNQPRLQLASRATAHAEPKMRVSVLVRVERPWISAGEDEVFLTVIPLVDKLTCNWVYSGVTLHQ